jgi:hypothetical protein
MAELMIHDIFVPFNPRKRDGFIFVAQVGLVKSRDDHMFTASPDVVCVLEYTTEGWATQDERPLARDVRKMPKMSEQTVMPATPVHDKEGRPPPGLGQVEISQEATLVVQEVKPVVQGTFATTDRQDHPTLLSDEIANVDSELNATSSCRLAIGLV